MLKNTKKQLFFYLISIVVLISSIEALLNLLAVFSPSISLVVEPPISPIIKDPILSHRPSPTYPGHDEKGFRNSYVPAQTDILIFGDSQTYGTGVENDQPWPRILNNLTQATTYNMAYGGYCPVHSLALWKEGITLEPKIIIEAFYTGNDLFDAFNLVYNQHTLNILKTKDSLLNLNIQVLENEQPLKEEITTLFNKGKSHGLFGIKTQLSKYSRIYGLLKSLKIAILTYNETEDTASLWNKQKLNALQYSNFYEILEEGQFKTIFTNTYRMMALDTADIRIQEGLDISFRAIKKMALLAKQKNIAFIVLGIPTKELVFRPFLQTLASDFEKTTNLETGIWEKSIKYYKENNIHFIDGLKPLRQQLKQGKQPYHQSKDGHINQLGHKVIAKEVQLFLDSLQILK